MYVYPIKSKQIFTAGKVHLFSDFDGTYLPKRQSTIYKQDVIPELKQYCSKMNSFFSMSDGDLDFHITTGRNFGEYQTISEKLRDKKYRLPLPETLISKDGSDEYIRIGSESDFYDKNIFPFEYTRTNKSKESDIKTITNWDGVEIKDYIKQLAKRLGIEFIENDTQHSAKHYGEKSLYSEGKLQKDDWKKLPQKDGRFIEHKTPIVDLKIGSKNNGNLKVKLIFPPDYDYCSQRTKKYEEFIDNIKKFMDNKAVKYSIRWEKPDKRNHYRKFCIITPDIENSGLTKVYDTKQALKKAVKENDFVVVAGNDSNDFDMLNPLKYIDETKWAEWEKQSSNKEFYNGKWDKKLKDLQAVYNNENSPYINGLREEFYRNGLLKEIEQLPLCGIVVKKEDSGLQILVDTFKPTGKIIEIPKGDLDNGVKTAVRQYGDKHIEFKNKMSEKFRNFIYEINIPQKQKPNKYRPLLIISLLAGFIGITGSLIAGKLKKNNEIITAHYA